ncbi:MAG: L-aspartate oxidase [Myxococcota bacterium]|nr:L-aspartate oxidase [Myxococcota bacterium]
MAISCETLILGSGLAALSHALEASKAGSKVIIATKSQLEETNTSYAQGGIAAVLRTDDSFHSHGEDTKKAGVGLCNEEIVQLTVAEGPTAIDRLVEAGVRFDRSEKHLEHSPYDLTREGGHSHRRILHSADITGKEIQRALIETLKSRQNVEILENHCAIDLLTLRKLAKRQKKPDRPSPEHDRVVGAYIYDERNDQVITIQSKVTLIATGGGSKVYLYTSNPDIATGDGVAMAWRAGAKIANMEFIQFHPTCLYHPEAKSFLISEALRGEGGILRRIDGTRFMSKYHELKELAPRDIVARAIDSELKRTGDDYVVLDMTHLDGDFVANRFPNIHRQCLEFGIDMTAQPIPVVPAAHYVCGGILTDKDGASTVKGLFVAGEAACTGLHGANRLASNSLLEAAVFGHRSALAARTVIESSPTNYEDIPPWHYGEAVASDELVVISQCWDEIRRFMWNYVGIVRSDRRLLRAWRRIETIREEIREFYWRASISRDLLELRNIAVVAELIVSCARLRKESRGLHYTLDYPEISLEPPKDTIIQRENIS